MAIATGSKRVITLKSKLLNKYNKLLNSFYFKLTTLGYWLKMTQFVLFSIIVITIYEQRAKPNYI